MTVMHPERRSHKRTKMVLPVKVSIGGGTQLAHTLDITCSGARLGGVRLELQVGQTVSLTRGSQKAKFRIIWIRQLGKNEFQAGIEAVQPHEKFWGVDLASSEREMQENVDVMMSLLTGASKSNASRG